MSKAQVRTMYKLKAIAMLKRRYRGEYVAVDFGEGPIEIIRGDGSDLSPEEAKTLAEYRYGFRLFGAQV